VSQIIYIVFVLKRIRRKLDKNRVRWKWDWWNYFMLQIEAGSIKMFCVQPKAS